MIAPNGDTIATHRRRNSTVKNSLTQQKRSARVCAIRKCHTVRHARTFSGWNKVENELEFYCSIVATRIWLISYYANATVIVARSTPQMTNSAWKLSHFKLSSFYFIVRQIQMPTFDWGMARFSLRLVSWLLGSVHFNRINLRYSAPKNV